jgi:hypothetical protein
MLSGQRNYISTYVLDLLALPLNNLLVCAKLAGYTDPDAVGHAGIVVPARSPQ